LRRPRGRRLRNATRGGRAVGGRRDRRGGADSFVGRVGARARYRHVHVRSMSVVASYLEATIRTAPPLLLASPGEVGLERAGVINIGLEGVILAGAFGALVGATHAGVLGGFVGAIVCGVAIIALFAAFVLWVRADQIITGTAISLLALGLTGTLYRALYGA